MPLYVYRAKSPTEACNACREGVEVFQQIREEALTACPECGTPVVRIIHATPTVRDSSDKKLLSDDNLKKHGFKKLVNTGGGKYDEVV
ncbi:MAG: zinc ribbon domain-containing protein [Candidatus Riflebacteria bacterium]|nr:zinc ribbon domain-containing protein [Candidatus Riflebacteria bacterium]